MPDERSAWADIGVTRPHAARVYDFVLGGKDNFAADREYAAKVMTVAPEYPQLARVNREFLIRTVRLLAESGVRQFIDLGTGIPTSPNVHEVARAVEPSARVVYVDNDPIVATHNAALLADDPRVVTIRADIRRPDEILANAGLTSLIDFAEPVGVLLVAVLHVISHNDDPTGIVARFRERMAPGSHLVISQLTTSGSDSRAVAQTQAATANTSVPVFFRSSAEILRFFDGLDMVEPGLVSVAEWRAEAEPAPTRLTVAGGVGRKP